MDIAQQITRFDKVIARIKIAVVLECWTISAGWSVDAEQVATKVRLQGYVEHLNKNVAYIVAHPFLENIHEEMAVLLTADRAIGYQVPGLRIKQALPAGLFAPAHVSNIDRFGRCAFDDRNELQPLGAHLVAEKAIDVAAVLLVGGVHRT